MSNTINIGIDLGTTNSLIACCMNGVVEVFQDPGQGRETLPSIVGFRKERILIGQQARTFAEKDPKSVISRFKRKMGTTESFRVDSLGKYVTPVDLSSFVLKELKTFVHTGEKVDAAVITVPASFDTVQSSDTRQAGLQAGFGQVVLLQEPIAASLAYANKQKSRDLRNSRWLVYDLGGGTFDVALIKIVDGELKVIDHEGDNFLGGTDFDAQIVEKLVIPEMEDAGRFEDLETQLKGASGRYNSLWYHLLHQAEEAKILLSTKTSADITFEVADDDDVDREFQISITRSDFDAIIKPHVDRTADMIKSILTRNSLLPADIQFVLMVGGSTYIPCVRKRIEELLQIPVNCEINPVTAVVIGAAHFAATREKKLDAKQTAPSKQVSLRVKAVFNRATQDVEELFSAKIEGVVTGLSYRITRTDGGYDSGLKSLTPRISEDLSLQPDAYNSFNLQITDQQGNLASHDLESIQIAHGKYSVAGQSASHDICLIVDDLTQDRTKLLTLFQKNQILPAKRNVTVSANKTVLKGADDQVIILKVVEGDEDSSPESNLEVGCVRITGKLLHRDLIKGSDIELAFELSESRVLTVSAYLTATDQVFEKSFDQQRRDVVVETLIAEVGLMHEKIADEVDQANKVENYEIAGRLTKLQLVAQTLASEVTLLSLDDSTDDRYKLEDRKCKVAKELDSLTRGKKLDRLRAEYNEVKQRAISVIDENGNDREKRALQEIVRHESSFLTSSNPAKIQQQIDVLFSLKYSILRRMPQFLIDIFGSLVDDRAKFNDQSQAKSLIESGRNAISNQNFDRLDEIISGLINLLPNEQKVAAEKSFTGISSQ